MSMSRGPHGPTPPPATLPPGKQALLEEAARALPARAQEVLGRPTHRALGRVVRDAVLLLLPGTPVQEVPAQLLRRTAERALSCLASLQSPGGTFRGGDNVDSPPDSAFTLNDLAWARTVPGAPAALAPALDRILDAAMPALITGGVHTPNHRWEIASALCRLWQALGHAPARARAEQWLAEGVDLQPDGMFSERSANYAAHVSIPALTTMARILERAELQDAADLATRCQAGMTDSRGLVETLASRRQDQFAPFDGGALYPWFRAHAGRTGDPLTARAALRTQGRAGADAVLTFLAHVAEDRRALEPMPVPLENPVPEAPEVITLAESGLVRIDHGSSSTVLFGGTDMARLGRIASGTSSRPTFARFRGHSVGLREMRLSRDFFSIGPLRLGPPRPVTAAGDADSPVLSATSSGSTLRYDLSEEVRAEYFQPLGATERDPAGRYALDFNGRFAAAMAFSQRPTQNVSLCTDMRVTSGPGQLELRWQFYGPATPVCLLLSFEGEELAPLLVRDEQGRHVLSPDSSATDETTTARCTVTGEGEQLEITACGALGGPAFYDPGEAYTFLGGSDEPDGDVLLVPASSSTSLTLHLRIRPCHP